MHGTMQHEAHAGLMRCGYVMTSLVCIQPDSNMHFLQDQYALDGA